MSPEINNNLPNEKDSRIAQLEQALALEAALERVRAASMAMHKTEELSNVVTVLFNQFEALDIEIIMAFVGIYHHIEEKYVDQWFSPIKGVRAQAFYIKLPSEPWENTTIKDWKAGKEMSFESIHGAKAIKAYAKEIDAIANWSLFSDMQKKLALTTIEQTEANHQYGNLSIVQDRKATESEINILKRFAKVFEQAYTRFLDIQKAEAQTKEAQIEAALERVRAASMGMHKSEDLPEVALVTVSQLEALGIQQFGSSISIADESNGTFIMYSAHDAFDEREKVLSITKPLAIDTNPIYREVTSQIQKGNNDFSFEIKGKVLKGWIEHNKTNIDKARGENIEKAKLKKFYGNVAAFRGLSSLSISSAEAINEADRGILRRMADVFGQSYQRYLDLQKAEAQVREAQIEAGLERVRAASMAMHKSEELPAVALAFFKQIEQLGIPINATSINLVDEVKESYQLYFANENDIGMAAELAIKDFWYAQASFRQLKEGQKTFTVSCKGAKLKAVIDFIKKEVSLERGSRLEKAKLKNAYLHTVQFHDLSHIIFTSIAPFSEATLSVLSRMTKVFGRSYTRFLDLQKAEEQAREAQIEAALERVRAASMAMHKSEELPAVALAFFKQIEQLGIPINATTIALTDEAKESYQAYFANENDIGMVAELAIKDFWYAQASFRQLKKGKKAFTIAAKGAKLKAVIDFIKKEVSLERGSRLEKAKLKKIYMHTVQFHDLSHIMFTSIAPFSEATLSVLSRMTKVFGMSYVRFLDLQKAEAQAKEAQIEVALERVRAASMAMHKTSQLIEVTTTLFEELKVLELEINVAWISLIHRENNSFETWITGFDKQFPEAFNFGGDYNDIPEAKEVINRWLKGEEFIVYDFVGNQALQSHIDGLIALTGIQHFNIYKSFDYMQNFEIFHKYGTLGMSASTAFTPHQKHVLKRFSIVFEQAYTRFLDIQKAETQAREAQIEAALEKVRAKTASMYKSTELEAVVSLVFQQLRLLDFDSKQCIIGIIDKATLEIEIWQSVDAQSGLPNSYKIPKLDHPFIQEGYDAYLNGEQYHERELSGAAKKSYDKLIFEQTDLKNVPAEVKAAIIQNEKIVTGSAYMSHGVIQVIGAEALSAEKAHILQRFAAAIDLTYTRFLDIQKAEQQKIQLEKVFSENQRLLHSILPAPIAEQIRQGQQTVVKRFEQVSILFADIVGFTVLSDRISPQEVVDILNGLFSKFDDLTDKYGLEKIKTIGDAYMVAAGVPEEKDNHAQLMFAFAKDMLHTLQGYNKVIGTDLKIRIGISSGPVVAGVIGKKKFAYDLWGDTVNTAARMEAYGHADCIQVSPTTYAILKKEATFEKIPNVAIKGKGTMDVYLWKE